jgi:hypothetical protein
MSHFFLEIFNIVSMFKYFNLKHFNVVDKALGCSLSLQHCSHSSVAYPKAEQQFLGGPGTNLDICYQAP